MSPAPYVTPRSVFIPSSISSDKPHSKYLLFFIPGNPGCMEYYTAFFSHLSEELSAKQCPVDIYAHAMANFYDESQLHIEDKEHAPHKVLGLRGQIQFVDSKLWDYVEDQVKQDKETQDPVRVMLVGHSVGAYIGLEILKAWRELDENATSEANGDQRDRHCDRADPRAEPRVDIVGLIGLWPTITWIGKSVGGRRLGWMLRLPGFAVIISFVAKILTILTPKRVLVQLIRAIAGMPADAARVTADFICSRKGVEQALHMARDEMLDITEDRWNENVWGAATPTSEHPTPKLIFYFGKDDHWVADHTRDELIAVRGHHEGSTEAWKAKMLIDDENIPHSFCIRHSLSSAKKTARFVEEIIENDRLSSRSRG